MNMKVSSLTDFWLKWGNSKINILIIWRGWWNHDAPNLTDTIMLASFDTKTNIISMLSIPRDLLVIIDQKGTKSKINEIYARHLEWKKKSKEEAIIPLEEKVTQITGEKIDYFVNLDFEWFKKFIDFIWGVEVTVEENLVDNEYPTENGGYETFMIKKGTWVFDGETALKYARSRHSTSDFNRSIRQQKIVNAIKNQVIQEGFLTSPSKITQIYSILSTYISTNLDLQTIISLALNAKQGNQILSFNLNDSCFLTGLCFKGGFLYVPPKESFNWWSVLIPQKWDAVSVEKYDDIKKYSNLIFNVRDIFTDNIEIKIYNSTKQTNLARIFGNEIYRFGFNVPNWSLWNTKWERFPVTEILYNNLDDSSSTLSSLSTIINAPLKKIDKPLYSGSWSTKIEVIIWDDYQKYLNSF